MRMTRYKAAATHLAISAAIAATVIFLISVIWYPAPLFNAAGGQLLLILIIGVDVCIGPLLTLVVFNPAKTRRHLAMDLSVIVVLQLAALIYGVCSSFEGRPVYLTFGKGSFVMVTANNVDDKMLQDARDPQYRSLPLMGPRWVGAQMPKDPREISDLNFAEAATGMGIHYLPKYFIELPALRNEIVGNAKPLGDLRKRHPEFSPQLDMALTKAKKKAPEVGYIPLRAKRSFLTVLVDRSTGEVLDTLDVNPL